eukprot:4076678-Amphidinium_carterae.1
MDPKTPRTPKKDGGKPRANATASAAAKSPAKREKKKKDGKDGKTPRNKDGKGKKPIRRPKAREAALLKTPTLNLNKFLRKLKNLRVRQCWKKPLPQIVENLEEKQPQAYATKTKTPMLLEPAGKAYALANSGIWSN